MRLQALVEVVGAQACCNNGDDEQEDCENGKGSQRLAGWLVVLLAVCIGDPHSDELEQEVAQGDEVDDDNADHTSNGLAADPPRGKEQKKESDNEGGSGEDQFNGLCVFDDDQKLDGEGQKEEEVKLEEGDVNLCRSQ